MTAPAPTEMATHRRASAWPWYLVSALLIATSLLYVFWSGLGEMVSHWSSPNYSYAYIVPLVAAWMFLQRYERLSKAGIHQSWLGVAVLFVGLALAEIGDLSTTYSLIQYAFLVALGGVMLTVVGVRGSRILLPAFLYLAFMVPLPFFFQVELTAKLQLLSTQIGIAFLRALSIPVFVEGNVIDLGSYQLEVAEACSGLRYLYPLLSFGFIMAYIYRGPLWQRILLFLSAIPITILMNGLRIGAIGVAVDHSGIAAAQGFMHLFEGWVVFLLCLAILLGEAALLVRFGGRHRTLLDALDLDMPDLRKLHVPALPKFTPFRPLVAAVVLTVCVAFAAAATPEQFEAAPAHRPLDLFPTTIGGWRGVSSALDGETLERLKLDDYTNIDYVDSVPDQAVNLYVAYYASQLKGAAIHSPHNCLPAGGWQVQSDKTIALDVPGPGGKQLKVNRVMIRKGSDEMLLYYWFQERGRIITEEYAGKWYVFLDSILKHRTDGALVRLATPVDQGSANADARLKQFATEIEARLPAYIPN